MFNIIKADLYRMTHSIGFYITIMLFLILTVMQTLRGHMEPIDIFMANSPSEMTVSIDENGDELFQTNPIPPYTGRTAPLEFAWVTNNLIFFILPLIVIISEDISGRTVKNLIAGGVSRLKLYFSKLILCVIACGALLLLHIVLPIILATVRNGFGGEFNTEYLKEIARIYLPQFCLLSTFVCIGVFLIFTFKKSVYLITGYLVFAFLPIVVTGTLLPENYDKFALMYVLKWSAFSTFYEQTDLKESLIFGSALILICTIAGLLLFRKSEIK